MKIAFVSNILNHHQMFLCDELNKRSDEFYFIATEDVKACGYQKSIEADYVVKYYDNDGRIKTENVIKNFDVIIFGACPDNLIDLRMIDDKLSFLYSERIFKKGTWRRFIPKTAKKIYNRYLKYKDKNLYVLSASSYLPYDLRLMHFPIEKCYKFGYFPEVKHYDDIKKVIESKCTHSILWVARLLKLKHPETPVKIAKQLKAEGYNFELNMVGDGVCREKIERLIKKYKLNDKVHLLGDMSPEEVRDQMEKAEIFLFTSSYKEGWGAVVNEAMNSSCAVIVSNAAGAASYLIKDGENGVIYKYGNNKDLLKKVKFLLDNEKERKEISENAYKSIVDYWNYGEAAKRFIAITENLLNGKDIVGYSSGPLSKNS